MARKSNTPRTLKLLREWDFYYSRTEMYNAFSGKKSDLFNIIDYVAITPFSTIGIQVCGADFSAHIKKLTYDELDNTGYWLSCKSRKLILIGWRKVLKKKGMKLKIYRPRIAIFYLDEEGDVAYEEKNTNFYGV